MKTNTNAKYHMTCKKIKSAYVYGTYIVVELKKFIYCVSDRVLMYDGIEILGRKKNIKN